MSSIVPPSRTRAVQAVEDRAPHGAGQGSHGLRAGVPDAAEAIAGARDVKELFREM
ncbi:hypothetical protein ACWGDT_34270 [Streptomyces avermitilis]